MNHKKIGIIFLVLLLLALIPFPFTKGPQVYGFQSHWYTGGF